MTTPRQRPWLGRSAPTTSRWKRRWVGPVTALALLALVTVAVALVATPAGAADGSLLLAATGSRSVTEDRKIAAVVGGLVAVALALSLLTVRYWRQTRPARPPEPAGADGDGLTSAEVVADQGAPGRKGHRDERVTDRRAARAGGRGPAGATALAKVDAGPRRARGEVGRRSRRAVAGADHTAADHDWEPRGTGEHDRIEVPRSARAARPGPSGRRAALQRDRD